MNSKLQEIQNIKQYLLLQLEEILRQEKEILKEIEKSNSTEIEQIENTLYNSIINLLSNDQKRKEEFLNHPLWKNKIKNLINDPNEINKLTKEQLRLLLIPEFSPGIVIKKEKKKKEIKI